MDDRHGPGGRRLRHPRRPRVHESGRVALEQAQGAAVEPLEPDECGEDPAIAGDDGLEADRPLRQGAQDRPGRKGLPIRAAMDERSVTKERSNGASPWPGCRTATALVTGCTGR
ncbi:hypothetical protein AMK13_37160 [Streptomyces sp. CB02056]|nr:hypothetical protein AMK13_37160 [Streptomyces sp. CB02056]